MENFDLNFNIKNLKKFIYQENLSDFNEKKRKFENILNCKIKNEIFEILYYNSINCPGFNILNKQNSAFVQELFVESKGRLPSACKWLYKSSSKFTNSLNDTNFKNISIELNEKGYYVKKNFLNKYDVNQIKNELLDFEYFSVKNINKFIKLKNIKKENYDSAVFASNLTNKVIGKHKYLNKFITSKFIEETSKYYFECQPYLVGVVAFHTKPKDIETFSIDEKHRSAQYFHYDQAHLKFLKFFLYLNDINDINDGAHSFVESSHEKNLKLPSEKKYFETAGLRRLNNGYYTGNVKNSWITENYNKKQILDFCYPAGTLIAENTTGFHKGNNCTTEARDMISVIVAISALSPNDYKKIPTIEMNENYDHSTKEYLSIINFKERKKKEGIYKLFNQVSLFKKIKNYIYKILSKFF